MYYLLFTCSTILFSIVVGLSSNFLAELFGYKENGFFSGVVIISLLIVYIALITIFKSIDILIYFSLGSIFILTLVLGYDKHKNIDK